MPSELPSSGLKEASICLRLVIKSSKFDEPQNGIYVVMITKNFGQPPKKFAKIFKKFAICFLFICFRCSQLLKNFQRAVAE